MPKLNVKLEKKNFKHVKYNDIVSNFKKNNKVFKKMFSDKIINGKIINIPKKIEYEDFINLIIRGIIPYINKNKWIKLVNVTNLFDNTYPLFWACEYGNYDIVKLLVESGAEYIPDYNSKGYEVVNEEYKNDIYKLPINVILSMIDEYKEHYLYVNYKIMIGKELTDAEEHMKNKYENYIKIVEYLLERFPEIINNTDAYNISYLYNCLYLGNGFIFDVFIKDYSIIDRENIINISKNFKTIFLKNLLNFRSIEINSDEDILFKEYVRYNYILLFFKIKKVFAKSKILNGENIEHFQNVMDKGFGTFNYYDSILKDKDNDCIDNVITMLFSYKHKDLLQYNSDIDYLKINESFNKLKTKYKIELKNYLV